MKHYIAPASFAAARLPLRHALAVAVSVFLAEALVMAAMAAMGWEGGKYAILLDSAFLIVILSPALYLFLYIPLRKEAALRVQSVEAVMAAVGDGLCVLDRNCRVLYQNQAHMSIAGARLEQRCFRGLGREEAPCDDCPQELSFRDGGVHRKEIAMGNGGRETFYELSASPLRDSSGSVVAGIQVARETTEQKNMNEALRKTTESLRALILASPLAIMALDPEGRITMWNPAAESIFGWSEAEALGSLNPIVPEDKLGEFQDLRERVLTGEGFTGVEVRRRRKDGSPVDIRIAASPLSDARGGITGIMALCEDITVHRQMEEQIVRAKQEWEDTFDTITDMITIHDRDFNILRANRAAAERLGLPVNQVPGVKCFSFYHGADCAPLDCPSCVSLRTGEPALAERFEPHLNLHVEIRAIPRFDHRNELSGLIHIVRDITEKKRAEEKIRRHISYINALRTVDMAITSSLDLRVTLAVLLEQVVGQLRVDAARVLLLNPHSQALEYAAGRGEGTEPSPDFFIRLGNGHAGRAALERKPVVIEDLLREADPGIAASAGGFRAYVGMPLIVKGHVKGMLEILHGMPLQPEEEWMDFLSALAGQAAVAIDNALMFDDLLRSHDELILAYDATIEGWSRALDYRDKETEGHSQRVTEVTMKIARRMGMKEEELVHVRRGALLHDIGKLGVPDSILFKAGELTEEEWKLMRRHPVIAHELLSPIPFLRPAMDIPYCHHEKWDGTGYPRGLRGEDIPLAARIFTVVDVWDALCSDRPYRPAWPKEKVMEHIRCLAGTHFDPGVAEIFLAMEW